MIGKGVSVIARQHLRIKCRMYSVAMEEEELGKFRDSIRKWVLKVIIPSINKWEAEGLIPRRIYKEAAELGILGHGYPVEYGGFGNSPSDLGPQMVIVEEVCPYPYKRFTTYYIMHSCPRLDLVDS